MSAPGLSSLSDQIQSIPRSPGIYALESPGRAPHLSRSSNLRARLTRLLLSSRAKPEGPGPENLLTRLKDNLARVQCWPTASRLETSLLMHALAKRHFPADYLVRMRLRMPWFATLSVDDPFPRFLVLNRIPSKPRPVFGPFLTRDLANEYEQKVLSLFQIRRCVEFLAPAPEHPGCIYGEMNQCLRPCQCAVTAGEYGTEAARVAGFLSSNGKSMLGAMEMARDRAAEATDFEQAAYLHKRLERVKEAAAARDNVITDINRFNGIALTRGLEAREFRLWPMIEGYWQDPLTLNFPTEQSRPASLDRELREKIAHALVNPAGGCSPLEDLAIFSRWYYSSWRDGHWFPFRTLADLNYRKLVRAVSNLAKQDTELPLDSKPC